MNNLIQQTNGYDCGLTAIAMALGYESLEACWTEEQRQKVVTDKGMTDVCYWLEQKGLLRHKDFLMVYAHGQDSEKMAKLLWKRRAVVSICSLNEPHNNHLIYWNGERVFDPQEGREGKLYVKYLRSTNISYVVLLA